MGRPPAIFVVIFSLYSCTVLLRVGGQDTAIDINVFNRFGLKADISYLGTNKVITVQSRQRTDIFMNHVKNK